MNDDQQALSLPLEPVATAVSTAAAGRLARSARLLITLIGGLLFGLAVGIAVVAFMANQFFGFKILNVQTGSMRPTLNPGDLVIIRPTSIDKIKERDIVLYQDDKNHVQIVHRVVAIHRVVTNFNDPKTGKTVETRTDISLVTQGDANANIDPTETKAETLKGRLWFSIPRVGHTTDLPLQTALFAFAGLIAVAWASWEVYHRLGKRTP